jgi:hypothetical protein
VHISNPSFLYHPPSIFITTSPLIIMPIDLSNLSAEDITAATTAVEAARRAREERECREAEDRQRWQEEEQACQEVTAQKEAEERKEAEAQKAKGALGLRQGGAGSSGGRSAAAVTHNGALGPQTHHPGTC